MYTFDVNGRITDPNANEGTAVDSIMAPNSMISSVVHYDYALDETDATSEETQYTYNGSSLTYASVGDDKLYFAYDVFCKLLRALRSQGGDGWSCFGKARPL